MSLRPFERIPLHNHVDRNDGGAIHGPSIVAAIGGESALGGSTTTITAGTYELATEGGQSVIKAHGAMGATETFDPTDGNVHTGTLDANCTFTLNVPTGTGAATLELYLTQDGTGSRTITWPGSVIWPGGTAPTLSTAAASVDRIILETLDGGTNWYGVAVGGGSSLTVKDEGGALATAATSLDFVGAGVTASGTGAAKTITIAGGSTASDVNIWRPVVDGAGAIILASGQALMALGPA